MIWTLSFDAGSTCCQWKGRLVGHKETAWDDYKTPFHHVALVADDVRLRRQETYRVTDIAVEVKADWLSFRFGSPPRRSGSPRGP